MNRRPSISPVIQEEIAGCGIASVAALTGISYPEAKHKANNLGIYADDKALWSKTGYVRKLLKDSDISVAEDEAPFTHWDELPDTALLAIKWHTIAGSKAYWHWVVFIREEGMQYVLDSKKALQNHVRTDFGRMKPKWFIEVHR